MKNEWETRRMGEGEIFTDPPLCSSVYTPCNSVVIRKGNKKQL